MNNKVTKKEILSRLDVADGYAEYKENFEVTENSENFFDGVDVDSEFLGYGEIDDYSKVEVDNHILSADIVVCNSSGQHVRYADSSGRYVFNREESAVYYRGLHSRSLAFPQCKMMNNTVRDWEAKHPIYIVKSTGGHHQEVLSTANNNNAISEIYKRKSDLNTHISFDVWAVIGAVYGHVLSVWRKNNRDVNSIPEWLYIPYSELFRIINPEYRWNEVSASTRLRWKNYFRSAFTLLNSTALEFDLPDDCWGKTRSEYRWPVLFESDEVSWSSKDIRQKRNSIKRWGTPYEPIGIKARIRGSALFDFIFKSENTPRVVQINDFDLKTKSLWGGRGGLCRSLHTLYMNWLVQYRNYFLKRGLKYLTCEKIWSQAEMNRAFAGSSSGKLKKLSADEMLKMMEAMTISARGDTRHPAHISSCEIVGRCKLSWSLPDDFRRENVFAKDNNGVNHQITNELLIPSVEQAKIRMDYINEENSKHNVRLDGNRIQTAMSAIFRIANGKIVENDYGRCYSFQNGFQALKSNDRLRMTIGGKKVCEVDYSGLHIRMLYAMEGLSPSGDVYDIGDWYSKYGLDESEARMAVKQAVLMMVNAKTKWRAFHAFKKDWNTNMGLNKKTHILWLMDLFNRVESKHSVISKYFCSNVGISLQWQDGIIMRNVCWQFAKRGICALPIHDSLVVPEKYANDAAEIMDNEFKHHFNNISCPVKIKIGKN